MIPSNDYLYYHLFGPAGSDDDQSSDDMEVDAEECKARAAEKAAQQQRKKAGLPELVVDALPSTICNRMLILI